jgi:hypothetical protein
MRQLIQILTLVILPFASVAQSFKFEATISKGTVGVGEQFSVTYAANGSISNFSPPKFNGFQIRSGPNPSTSMSYVNGKVSRKESYGYVLVAEKIGTYTFPPASVKSGGNVYKSKALTIKVVKGTKKKSNAGVTSANLFLHATPSKRTVYKGEQLPVTYTVNFNLEVSHSETMKLPSLNGFWTEDVSVPRQASVYSTTIDNVRYNAADLMKKVLFPQRSGTLELDQMEFKVFVRTRTQRRSFFDSGFRDDEYILKSVPVKIKVKPLPEKGKPDSFDGAVGSFSFKTEIDKDKLQANDAVTLNIRVKGTGNLKLIEAPKLQLPPDIETFDPKISSNIKVGMDGVSGYRTFEYLLIPRHAGEYVISPIKFSYFDPAKKKYVEQESPEYKLSVAKGDEQATTTLSTINKENVKFIGSDIRYIVDAPFVLFNKGSRFFMSKPFYAAYVSPVLLLLFLLLMKWRHVERNKDIVQVRRRRANKLARKSLARSKAFINKDKGRFYQEVLKGLWGYLGMKLSVDVADLSKESIRRSLADRSVSEGGIDTMIALLDKCEFAQYAPEGQGEAMDGIYEAASEAISIIEDEIS